MTKDQLDNKSIYEGDYEADRKKRYVNAVKQPNFKLIEYGSEEIAAAYSAWANSPAPQSQAGKYEPCRDIFWDDYCDMRDGMPIGTNQIIRIEQKVTIH